jgi:gag-polypeptide of LTR copia-type
MAKVHEKTIRLTGLVPENYRLWASQSESIFRVFGVLNIVLGRESHPHPERAASSTLSDTQSDTDVQVERPITAAQRKSIEQWQSRHDLARQALLTCLEPTELTKIYHLQLAHEIWKRLADEYGAVSDLKRAQASAAFYTLQKRSSMSMPNHINAFTQLQQEVNYHREAPLSNIDVNLTFLQSLGEPWKTFQQSIAPRLHSITPPTLFSEVLAFENSSNHHTQPTTDPMALHTQARPHPKHTSKPYDRPNQKLFYRYYKRKGYKIDDYLKKRWKDTQAMEEEEEEERDMLYDFRKEP